MWSKQEARPEVSDLVCFGNCVRNFITFLGARGATEARKQGSWGPWHDRAGIYIFKGHWLLCNLERMEAGTRRGAVDY